MSSTVLGLRTTIYKVGDLASAKDWYTKAFSTRPYFDEPFYVGFNIAGYELGLMEDDTDTSHKSANVLTYWGVEDIEKEISRLKKLGASPDQAATNVGGEIVVASIKDPWGNIIGLIFNPEFKLPE